MQIAEALAIAEAAVATPEGGSEEVEATRLISSIYHKCSAYVFTEFGWLGVRTSSGIASYFQTC